MGDLKRFGKHTTSVKTESSEIPLRARGGMCCRMNRKEHDRKIYRGSKNGWGRNFLCRKTKGVKKKGLRRFREQLEYIRMGQCFG